ncbi:hypothetical protein Pcac1_g7452 [Phytophthora cactorum]|nr:hypothetical protein Pcac1_g7452 [Phytophthora cactorum]
MLRRQQTPIGLASSVCESRRSSLIDDVKAAYASDARREAVAELRSQHLPTKRVGSWHHPIARVHIVIVCTKDCCYTAQ